MNYYFIICQILLLFCLAQLSTVEAHGRLMDPVARGSRWRYNSSAPRDYDDMQGWCGGYSTQWDKHKGKCGLCGNTYSDRTPRQHELGGKYGEGVIVKYYKAGSTINVNVEITANHWGNFKFDVCNIDKDRRESEQCFRKYKLKLSNGKDRYVLQSKKPGWYKVSLKLPKNLNCKHCVFRWTYTAANRWGTCEDGSGKLGCGPQEHFVGCSDVSISKGRSIFEVNEENTEENSFAEELEETLQSIENEFMDLNLNSE